MVDRQDTVSRLAKGLAPFAMGVFGIFILVTPVRLFEGYIPMPIIPMAVVFFWTIYDPQRLPSSSVFLIGLLQDALTGSPLGLWSTIYLLLQFVVLSQRSYFLGREPQVVWLGFVFAAVGVASLCWLIMSLMAGYSLPVLSLSFQIIATIFFYPFLGHAFRKIRHRVLVEA